jgi:hypothetical protein
VTAAAPEAMEDMEMERESVPFELAAGIDVGGRVRRAGAMRRATAADELEALRDFRVFLAPELFVPVLLAKTIVFDGGSRIDALRLRGAAPEDLFVLERLYRELNGYPAEVATLDSPGGRPPAAEDVP